MNKDVKGLLKYTTIIFFALLTPVFTCMMFDAFHQFSVNCSELIKDNEMKEILELASFYVFPAVIIYACKFTFYTPYVATRKAICENWSKYLNLFFQNLVFPTFFLFFLIYLARISFHADYRAFLFFLFLLMFLVYLPIYIAIFLFKIKRGAKNE